MSRNNGGTVSLEFYETPFADESFQREASTDTYPTAPVQAAQFESPFSFTYEAEGARAANQPYAESFVELLGELNHEDFKDSLIGMAAELEEAVISRYTFEAPNGMRSSVIEQRANDYFRPLLQEVDTLFQRVQAFAATDLESRSDEEIESFIDHLEFDHAGQLTVAQEQFFGGIGKKITGALKAGKKLLNKISPAHLALQKIKGLIKPLLKKVLDSLIGKLPKKLQPFAKDLAKRFVNHETPQEDPAITNSSETFSGEDFEMIQHDFDLRIANLVFSSEYDGELLLQEYLSDNGAPQAQQLITAAPDTSLDAAREKFINRLREGGNIQPAVEEFLPALYPAVKIAITIVGRQKVISFLANLLANLVQKYVPKEVAKPLASSIVDLGLGALGLELADQNDETLAYEVTANVIEETVRTLGTEGEGILNQLDLLSDQEAIDQLTEHVLPAFNRAVANNFPGTYVKRALQRTSEAGVWVLFPRRSMKKAFKKFSKAYNVTLTSQMAEGLRSFGDVSLKEALNDTLGQNLAEPARVRIHVYEAIPGTTVNRIALHDRIPGLGTSDKSAAVQIHPLSVQAAGTLLNEPALGKDMEPEFTTSPDKITVGQRLYYIQFPSASARRPKIRNRTHIHRGAENEMQITARTSDAQAVLNFVKSEATINFYVSEATANELATKLNRNDWIGAAESLRDALHIRLTKALLKNVKSKVKIIHESTPELYLRYTPEQEGFLGNFKKFALEKIVGTVVSHFTGRGFGSIKDFFKARSKEFNDALAQPDDGVTIRIIWAGIAGMAQLRSLIGLLKGDGALGDLRQISMPQLPSPKIMIMAGKNFM